MKTKEEILNMSKEELIAYKDTIEKKEITEANSNCYDCSRCSDCYDCFYCSDCYRCSDCYDCSYCYDCFYCFDCSKLVNGLFCRYLSLETKDYDKYYICNIEVTEEEFETKKKELEGKR